VNGWWSASRVDPAGDTGRVGGDFIGVHVVTDDGLRVDDHNLFAEQRQLVEELGGRAHEVVGTSTAAALVESARAEKATQLVLGASRRGRFEELLHGSFVAKVARLADGIDLHVIATDRTSLGGSRGRRSGARPVDRSRVFASWVLLVVGLPLATALMAAARDSLSLDTELLLFLALVLFIAALGGLVVAAIAAVVASLLLNWFFVEPFHTLTISRPENVVALVVFVLVAITVGSLVDLASRRSLDARRARVEAEALARGAATLAADPDPLPGLAHLLQLTFGLQQVIISEETAVGWEPIATAPRAAQDGIAVGSNESTFVTPIGSRPGAGPRHRLELSGRPLTSVDRRVLTALTDQLAVAIDTRHLSRDAAEALQLTEVDRVRTALLRAVSHDLRTPLASIKAMVSGLRDPDVAWTAPQVSEALATVDEETDRLNCLVGNLLDASRLQIGALAVEIAAVDLVEVVDAALNSLGDRAHAVLVDIEESVPLIRGDAALLERSVANCVSNAISHGGTRAVRITAGRVGDRVSLCIIDRGPGIPRTAHQRVLAPFQRFGDSSATDGVGLGMSIAQGFVVACGGSFALDDTPGGGLTVTLSLDVAQQEVAP
jgi:two-component system sensor histidine kinase KdpD